MGAYILGFLRFLIVQPSLKAAASSCAILTVDKLGPVRYTQKSRIERPSWATLPALTNSLLYIRVDQMISANILIIVLLIGLFLILIKELNIHGQPRM